MRFIKLLFVSAAMTLFAVACNDAANSNQTANTGTQPSPATTPTTGASATPAPADEFASTRATYATECARCHRADGEGGVVEILKKKLKVPSLKEGHALNHTEEQLAKQIREGGDGMPAFKDKLSEEEINNLVRYVRREIQGGAAKK
jgi:mono/diheme cytochrome c family protein